MKSSLYQVHDPKTNTSVARGKQRSGDDIFRAEDRSGIRAGDWYKETSTRCRDLSDEPQVDKPKVLIESARVIGADRLTAQDAALHEYLLACAREQVLVKCRVLRGQPVRPDDPRRLDKHFRFVDLRLVRKIAASSRRLFVPVSCPDSGAIFSTKDIIPRPLFPTRNTGVGLGVMHLIEARLHC